MFSISLTESALEDLRFFKKADQTLILAKIEEQLADEPLKETRHRKPLRPNDLSSWELRIGEFRVFFDVEETKEEVKVKAVGRKDHNKLYLRGEEFEI